MVAECELLLPKISVDFMSEQNKQWAVGNIGELCLKLVARPEDVHASITCERLGIIHPDQVLCPIVISSQEGSRAVDCSISITSVFSPEYKVSWTTTISIDRTRRR